MGTWETDVVIYQCPCGQGRITITTVSPDNPWSQWSTTVQMGCARCTTEWVKGTFGWYPADEAKKLGRVSGREIAARKAIYDDVRLRVLPPIIARVSAGRTHKDRLTALGQVVPVDDLPKLSTWQSWCRKDGITRAVERVALDDGWEAAYPRCRTTAPAALVDTLATAQVDTKRAQAVYDATRWTPSVVIPSE